MGKGADTRERILETAWRLAARDGLEGLSLGRLAEALGLSKSGLFAHFSSKEELQLEVLKTAASQFADAVLRPAFTRPRGLPRVRDIYESWVRWSSDPALPGGCLLRAASAELDDREGPARDFLVQTIRDLIATLARAARIAVEEGHFKKGLDCEQFAFELQAILLAYHEQHRLLRDPKCEKRARAAFEGLVRSASAES